MSSFEAGTARPMVGNEDEHRAARLALLAREKELNRAATSWLPSAAACRGCR